MASMTSSIFMLPQSGSSPAASRQADGDAGRLDMVVSDDRNHDGIEGHGVGWEPEHGSYRQHPKFGVVDIFEFGRRPFALPCLKLFFGLSFECRIRRYSFDEWCRGGSRQKFHREREERFSNRYGNQDFASSEQQLDRILAR